MLQYLRMGSVHDWYASTGTLASLIAKFETDSGTTKHPKSARLDTAAPVPKERLCVIEVPDLRKNCTGQGTAETHEESSPGLRSAYDRVDEKRTGSSVGYPARSSVQRTSELRSSFGSIAERKSMFEKAHCCDNTGPRPLAQPLLRRQRPSGNLRSLRAMFERLSGCRQVQEGTNHVKDKQVDTPSISPRSLETTCADTSSIPLMKRSLRGQAKTGFVRSLRSRKSSSAIAVSRKQRVPPPPWLRYDSQSIQGLTNIGASSNPTQIAILHNATQEKNNVESANLSFSTKTTKDPRGQMLLKANATEDRRSLSTSDSLPRTSPPHEGFSSSARSRRVSICKNDSTCFNEALKTATSTGIMPRIQKQAYSTCSGRSKISDTPSSVKSFVSIQDRLAKFESLGCYHGSYARPSASPLEKVPCLSQPQPVSVTAISISDQDAASSVQAPEGTVRPHQNSASSLHISDRARATRKQATFGQDGSVRQQEFIIGSPVALTTSRCKNKEEKGRTQDDSWSLFGRGSGLLVVQVSCELKEPVPFRAKDSRRLISLCHRKNSPPKILWSC